MTALRGAKTAGNLITYAENLHRKQRFPEATVLGDIMIEYKLVLFQR